MGAVRTEASLGGVNSPLETQIVSIIVSKDLKGVYFSIAWLALVGTLSIQAQELLRYNYTTNSTFRSLSKVVIIKSCFLHCLIITTTSQEKPPRGEGWGSRHIFAILVLNYPTTMGKSLGYVVYSESLTKIIKLLET